MLIFALLLIGNSIFMARLSFQQEFQILKDISLGAICIFTSLLAIVATARLLSQDIEDRTIYTILAKPVPRFEYLTRQTRGRSPAACPQHARHERDVFCGAFSSRSKRFLTKLCVRWRELRENRLLKLSRTLRGSAFNSDLLPGIAVIYLKACLLAALTLFVSTFASSNLFTIVVMAFVYFIGHLQATAREYWLQTNSAGWITNIFLAFVAFVLSRSAVV